MRNRLPSVGVAIVALLVILTCCTKADYNMGEGLIPNGQVMKVKYGSLKGHINTYNTITDYAMSNNINVACFGKASSAKFGKTLAGSIFQFSYYFRNDGNFEKGTNYTPDSLWIFTNVDYIGGDTLKEQTFYVYEVTKELYPDSAYYSSMDYTKLINPEPMFSFTYSGLPYGTENDTLKFKIENETLAKDYLTRLGTVDSVYYYIDTLFPANFYGLCVLPADKSPDDAALYSMSLKYSNGSYMRTFGHNYKTSDPTAVQDTIIRTFNLCDVSDYTNNVSINFIKHDYTGTGISPVPERLDNLGSPVSTAYMQGMIGVTTTLEFTDNFMNDLKALCPEGYDMVISQARLRVPIKEKSADVFNGAPERVGAYIDYGSQKNTLDYYYTYLDYITYDGFINRSNGWYTINVEFHLQRMLQDEDYSPRVTLGMLATQMYSSLSEVELIGSADKDIEVDITYTLVNHQE